MKKPFKQLHPLVLFLYYAGSLTILIMMLHPLFLGFALCVILAINFFEDRFKELSRWLIFMLTTGLFIVLLNPLFNERGRHVLFIALGHRITLEAVVYGGMNALLIICVMALFVSYNEVMTPNKLLYLFSGFLPQFAILLMLTLRFIPLMRRRLAEISAIQTSKGLSVVYGRWKDKVKNGMIYIQVLLVHSLEEAIQTADSMKARGYGQGKRSTYEFFLFQKKDFYSALFLAVLFLLLICGRSFGYGLLTIYPIMENWQLSFKEYIIFYFYLIYLSFPLLIELGGHIKWRLSN